MLCSFCPRYRGQFIAGNMQGFTQTGDIAVTKNAESAAAQAQLLSVNFDELDWTTT